MRICTMRGPPVLLLRCTYVPAMLSIDWPSVVFLVLFACLWRFIPRLLGLFWKKLGHAKAKVQCQTYCSIVVNFFMVALFRKEFVWFAVFSSQDILWLHNFWRENWIPVLLLPITCRMFLCSNILLVLGRTQFMN